MSSAHGRAVKHPPSTSALLRAGTPQSASVLPVPPNLDPLCPNHLPCDPLLLSRLLELLRRGDCNHSRGSTQDRSPLPPNPQPLPAAAQGRALLTPPKEEVFWGFFVVPQGRVGFCSTAGCQRDSGILQGSAKALNRAW